MSDAIGPGDLVLCVNAAPNHVTGQPVPLVAGETYQVVMVMEFACPCGRSDALLDVGVEFAWCQTRFRLLPKPKAEKKPRRVSAPKENRDSAMKKDCGSTLIIHCSGAKGNRFAPHFLKHSETFVIPVTLSHLGAR